MYVASRTDPVKKKKLGWFCLFLLTASFRKHKCTKQYYTCTASAYQDQQMTFQCENAAATISRRSLARQNTYESEQKGQALSCWGRATCHVVTLSSVWQLFFVSDPKWKALPGCLCWYQLKKCYCPLIYFPHVNIILPPRRSFFQSNTWPLCGIENKNKNPNNPGQEK